MSTVAPPTTNGMARILCWTCASGHHKDCERKAKRKRNCDMVFPFIKADDYVKCDCNHG